MGKLSILKGTSLLALIALILLGVKANAQSNFKVLVVASLAKDHWKSISVGKEFFEKLGAENHFSVDFTTDTSTINDANLANYKVFVMFHLAPFDMSASQQAALQKFVEQGKGWVGIHAAGLTGTQFIGPGKEAPYWQWFEGFLGGVIYSPHPAFQDGLVVMEDRKHPATRNMPEKFWLADEWYEYDKSPRGNVRVLATADESTYKQNKPMGDHPIVWTNENFRRMIYICIGHSPTALTNPSYVILVRDAILWAASK
jgi:type 1 glutamine amidotransferase